MRKPAEQGIELESIPGIAARALLSFYIGRWRDAPSRAGNADLSVDAFFALNGHVLIRAYARRTRSASIVAFITLRLLRPMSIPALPILIDAPQILAGNDLLNTETAPSTLVLAILRMG